MDSRAKDVLLFGDLVGAELLSTDRPSPGPAHVDAAHDELVPFIAHQIEQVQGSRLLFDNHVAGVDTCYPEISHQFVE